MRIKVKEKSGRCDPDTNEIKNGRESYIATKKEISVRVPAFHVQHLYSPVDISPPYQSAGIH